MSALLGLGGWLLATAGIGAAAIIWARLAHHLEAVTRACHEVRGPLTAVRLGLELRQLSHARLRAIELELGRASAALDELSAARPPRGSTEAVDVAELVGSSVEAWQAVAVAQGATLKLVRGPGSLVVAGDRLRLAQAVGNLLANAIEHGGGRVDVAVLAGDGTVRVEVIDGGPGLSAPVDQLVRRRRWRGRRERGHGLSIVTGIAAAHGGRLAAAPSHRGARLVLELPAARGAFVLSG